ncbi:MAG: Txe/YoeB family addiction module toxin, partial [Candidatus Atribacteria bacterium]
MNVIFSSQSWEEYLHWHKTDHRMLKRINALIKDI